MCHPACCDWHRALSLGRGQPHTAVSQAETNGTVLLGGGYHRPPITSIRLFLVHCLPLVTDNQAEEEREV